MAKNFRDFARDLSRRMTDVERTIRRILAAHEGRTPRRRWQRFYPYRPGSRGDGALSGKPVR